MLFKGSSSFGDCGESGSTKSQKNREQGKRGTGNNNAELLNGQGRQQESRGATALQEPKPSENPKDHLRQAQCRGVHLNKGRALPYVRETEKKKTRTPGGWLTNWMQI